MAALALILAMTAPAAFAQSGGDGYRTEGPSILDQSQGAPDDSSADQPSNDQGAPASKSDSGNSGDSGDVKSAGSSGDSLPFTGLDLALVAAAGASLVLMGVGMRRLTRAPDSV